MSIQHEQVTQNVNSETRTWRLNIEAPYGEIPVITAHRELVKTVNGEVLAKTNAGVVERTFSAIVGESFTCANGKVVTLPELAEVIAGLVDRWDLEN